MENLIFKAIVGSQTYGTATPQSDIDYSGVFMQPIDEIITFKYKDNIQVTKDESYMEVKKFIQLLSVSNPNALSLLYTMPEFVLKTTPQFELIKQHRDKFLTKKARLSFGGYAIEQIKKANGLNKKMNYEKESIVRKSPFNFTYAYENGKTIPISEWLTIENKKQELCGLVALHHFKDTFALYYDSTGLLKFKGIFRENSNQIVLSSVPKDLKPLTIVSFNQEAYSKHCREYAEYSEWLANRNVQRYVDVKNHNQQIDGKNLMHCVRLLDMAREIVADRTITLKRPNADYLISIRKGMVDLKTIIEKSTKEISEIDKLFKNSDLPEECDFEFVNDLLLQVRKMPIV